MFNKYLLSIITTFFSLSGLISTAHANNSTLQQQIEVDHPVIFQLSQGAKMTGSKMTIYNNTDNELIIESFNCEGFAKSMMHNTKYESGKRIMFEVQNIQIPAHKKLALTPNKQHLMMGMPQRKFELNEFVKITIMTNQGEFNVIAQIVPKRLK